jgi:hypothetical protein
MNFWSIAKFSLSFNGKSDVDGQIRIRRSRMACTLSSELTGQMQSQRWVYIDWVLTLDVDRAKAAAHIALRLAGDGAPARKR